MKLASVCLALLLFSCFHQAWTKACVEKKEVSGSEHFITNHRSDSGSCFLILPEDSFSVTLHIEQVKMDPDCNRFYVTVTTKENDTQKYCNSHTDTIITDGSVKIELIYEDTDNNASQASISFRYEMVRSIFVVEGVNATRGYLISRLFEQANSLLGWGEGTHRAMTALYLAGATSYVDLKALRTQLDLRASSALLMNSTHPVTMNELSLIVNALTAACQNPRNFYDQNLLKILEERANSSMVPNPNVILSLCVSGGNLEKTIVDRMFYSIMQNLEHSFSNEHKAMSLMALACLKKRTNSFVNNSFAFGFYEQSAKNLIKEQRLDGSFGNVYTTALVTQALIGTGQINNREWKLGSTLRFLMQHVNSSELDLQMSCLILPALSNKSLVDLAEVDCTNRPRPDQEEFKNGTMMQVFYSLFMGDQKKLVKTINVVMPVNSSALDVMKKAQDVHSVFKFQSMGMPGFMYIYKINGIANDYEVGKIWTLYTMPSFPNGTLTRQNISTDKLVMHHWEHLIMWYKAEQM